MRIVWQLGMLAGIVLAAAVAQGAQSADPFYQGLEQRGLRTLMEEYLRQQSGAGPAAAPGEQVNKLALARLQVQKALEAENMAARDSAFREARTFYEGAVADLGKALIAVPADRVAKRNEVRLDLINTRLELANMIFQKWLKTDLDMLEVTDRRAGDRARATELLRTANEQYKATLEEIQVWLSALDQLVPDERLKIINKGHRRRVTNAKRDAEYSNAWITFYYGWILPSDYKPKKGERKRSELLDDAITACQQYTAMPDRVSAKWYAYLVIGMAYRELGKFEEALQSLALADGANVPEADPN